MDTPGEMPYVFGIDFGTTNSSVTLARETEKPEVVNIDGRYIIP